jgi:uncharacterized protein YceK
MRTLMLLSLACCGCGTVRNLEHTESTKPFGGVAQSSKMIRGEGHMGLFLVPLGLLDLPLSLIGDVVTLPWTFNMAAARKFEGGDFNPPSPELASK